MPFVTIEYPIFEAVRGTNRVRIAPMPIGAPAAALVAERMIRAGATSLIAVVWRAQAFGRGGVRVAEQGAT